MVGILCSIWCKCLLSAFPSPSVQRRLFAVMHPVKEFLLELVLRPSAMKSGRSYGVTSASSLSFSWRTHPPLLADPSHHPPALHSHMITWWMAGALGLYADEANLLDLCPFWVQKKAKSLSSPSIGPALWSVRTSANSGLDQKQSIDTNLCFRPAFTLIRVVMTFSAEWNIIGMEILNHPLPLLLTKKDLGDGTILPGDWRLKQDMESSKSLLEPMPQIFILR